MLILSFWFLKKAAKEKLNGIYRGAFFGQLICYIPAYLFSSAIMLITVGGGNDLLILLLSLICEILVIDIFTVGYMRSLFEANKRSEDDEKRYDINLVLSGFSNNYKNTLKTMFLRRLYLFGWGALAFLPILAVAGGISFLSIRPQVSLLISYGMQFVQSPTYDMAINIFTYVSQNCLDIVIMLIAAIAASIIFFVIYVRKSYLYEMIPILLAENPDIPTADAMKATKEIMHGFRFKYFSLQISFIGLFLLAALIIAFIPNEIAVYIAMSVVAPYMNMTFIQFYTARQTVVEPMVEDNETTEE